MINQKMTPTEYAKKLILNYGWSTARSIAETEAKTHSPSGNLDDFWVNVLSAIDKRFS